MSEKSLKSKGQIAYEADVKKRPIYHDGTPRKTWGQLGDALQKTWEQPMSEPIFIVIVNDRHRDIRVGAYKYKETAINTAKVIANSLHCDIVQDPVEGFIFYQSHDDGDFVAVVETQIQ